MCSAHQLRLSWFYLNYYYQKLHSSELTDGHITYSSLFYWFNRNMLCTFFVMLRLQMDNEENWCHKFVKNTTRVRILNIDGNRLYTDLGSKDYNDDNLIWRLFCNTQGRYNTINVVIRGYQTRWIWSIDHVPAYHILRFVHNSDLKTFTSVMREMHRHESCAPSMYDLL